MSSNAILSDPNGAVVMGDVEYDGRVILYIIKGKAIVSVHHAS